MKVTTKQVAQARAMYGDGYIAGLEAIFGPGIASGFELDLTNPRFVGLLARHRQSRLRHRDRDRTTATRPARPATSIDRPAPPLSGPLGKIERAIVDLLLAEQKVKQAELQRQLGLGRQQVSSAVLELRKLGRVTYCAECRAKLTLT